MSMSPLPMPEALWHWVVEGAEPRTGTEEELVQQLSTGRLPPYALVWREGWGEWLPAMQVEALTEAFPDAGLSGLGRRTARPSVIPGVPPVPVSDYPRLRHLAKAAPLGWPDGFEGPERDVITSEVPAVVLQEAARAMTQPTPPRDLGLQEAIERASRLPPERASRLPERPALLPPERLPPERLLPEGLPSDERSEPLSLDRASHLPPEHSALIALDRAPAAYRVEERTPVSGPALPLAAELGLEALMAEATPTRSWAHWLRAHGLWLALGLGLLGLGVTFGLRWFGVPEGWPLATPGREVVRRSALSPALAPASTPRSTPGSGAESRPASALGCRSSQPPTLLDDWAVVDVRPVLHPLASGREVAIGYAQSHRSAAGGILDVASLRLERQFWQQQDRQVFSVTPLEVDGTLRYHVERQGTNVAFARAVAAEPPARVGASENALVLGKLDQRTQVLWPLPSGATVTVPEVAEHPLGFTLAMRASQDVGHVLLGLIDTTGAALAPLTEVGKPEWDLGRPALASGPEQTVLAVARRLQGEPGSEQTDELLLGHARNGQLPTELRRFELPAPVVPELGAPIVAALPDGSFALMWSQGSSTQRQVRLQRLSAELRPLGPPSDITPATTAGANATGAALHWVGDRLLAFYFSKRDAGHALWVGSLACGA